MALRVIGAGFGRTGTHSLKLALEQLGFAPCHHMYEVRAHPEQLAFWQAAARGELPDWDEVFAGFAAQVDWPGARFWRELAEHFPHAKVILSVRRPTRGSTASRRPSGHSCASPRRTTIPIGTPTRGWSTS
jgi:Sulfotransferase domain